MNTYDLWLIKTKKVPLTAHQLARANHLSASEAGILLGVHPFSYRPASEMDVDEAVQLGRLLERPILRWGARATGHRIVCNQFRVCQSDKLLSAQHDALSLTDCGVGFEAKTAGIRGGFLARELWGADGTDQVPEWIIAQVQQQMIVSGLETVWIPALIGGRGNLLYRVNRNEELCKMLVERAHDFWENHVLKDIPPPNETPSLDLARVMRRTAGKTVVINGWAAATYWRECDAKAKECQKEADLAKAAMLAEAGDAEIVSTDEGTLKISKSPQERIDTAKLRKEFPDVAKKVTKTTDVVRVTWKE